LLAQLTKRLVESALEGEITDHLGYYKYDAAGRDGNSRNGHRSKTVLTEVGPVAIDVPHDRDGSFEPKIVGKRNRCLSGIDELVISLSAKGLTIGDVQAHLGQVYGADVSRALYPVGGGRRPSLIADATPAWPPPPGSTAERPASGPSRAGNPANPVRVHTHRPSTRSSAVGSAAAIGTSAAVSRTATTSGEPACPVQSTTSLRSPIRRARIPARGPGR
jgi:hypothetical protein